MRNLTLVLIAVLAFAFASCSSKNYPDADWTNRQWTLVEIMKIPVQTSGSEDDAHLVFDSRGKTFSGSGGCNRIFGPYEIGDKQTFKFGEVGATRMACQDLPFENKFLETLKSVRYYQLSAGELLLKNGAKDVILRFQ
ncbi:META domain-containing protein [Algoriphagus aquimarinus]|uniref:Heat shock protein HslJ n=1 Tax=Algoriphagus aquimarinus TaxID=237018 RepID=A0A1I0VT56_9BACT|nr:META domain-containing protein [Algoriphagus aquimarinus]SFA79472.1 Heat shock protein HslJ [Algoriphagus aquimarinus]